MTTNRFRRWILAFDRLEDRWNPANFTVENASWDPTTQDSYQIGLNSNGV